MRSTASSSVSSAWWPTASGGATTAFWASARQAAALLVAEEEEVDAVFHSVEDLIRAGELRPVIAATYPLRELVKAQQEFVKKEYIGKIVVTVA